MKASIKALEGQSNDAAREVGPLKEKGEEGADGCKDATEVADKAHKTQEEDETVRFDLFFY